MKYPLHKELKTISMLKMPMIPSLMPLINRVMKKLFRCKSDAMVSVAEEIIPGYENQSISIYIIEPKHMSDNKLPCLVFFHGGGFMLRASAAHYRLAKEYAAKTPCKVIYADYRLAPEFQFPVPVEDCYNTFKWTIEHAEELNIDKERIAMGGDSAGGNLAAAVTLMARDRDLPTPCFDMLIYPVTDRRLTTESMKKYTDTPVWDAKRSKIMWECYLGKQQPEHMEYASPAEAISFDLFPPTYIEVAQYDCLRDEGICLYERLSANNIPVELIEIPSACHGFEIAVKSSITRTAMERRILKLQKHFEH